MTNAELKEFIEVKIDAIYDIIEAKHELQMVISKNTLEQATKTNGRVTKLEDQVKKVIEDENRHIVNCPRLPDIAKINDDITQIKREGELWRIALKYPKTALGIIVVSVVITLCVGGYSLLEMHKIVTDLKIEGKK